MEYCKWNVKAESDSSVNINIAKDVDLEGLELLIKNEFRIEIIKMVINSHYFSLEINTGRPIFAQINDKNKKESVQYVIGSGADAYKKSEN